jgi:hypothetical protein
MTKKDYADVLRFAIKLQVDYIDEELQEEGCDTRYLEGVKAGLQIALDKIDASMFLAEKE